MKLQLCLYVTVWMHNFVFCNIHQYYADNIVTGLYAQPCAITLAVRTQLEGASMLYISASMWFDFFK